MNAASVERLLLKTGQQPTAAHINALSNAVAQQTAAGGRGIRRRVLPWGTHVHYTGTGGGVSESRVFRPTVTGNLRDGFEVRFERGLIAGVEPSIDGNPLSKPDAATGKRPALLIPPNLMQERGEVGVYFRVSLGKDWRAEKAEPFASVDAPQLVPWKADKLACIVYADGTVWRALVWNEGLESIRRGFFSDGRATHLFFPS